MNNQKKKPDGVARLYSVFVLSLKPKKERTNGRARELVKGTDVKAFRNIYVRFRNDSVELSDWKNFRRFMYAPCSEVLQMNWEE